ncbi:MAG: hypothetical protein VX899_07605 [Myxococcota bacterium]|nr:hypothetical protein [Myxococcota bacterium]
MDPIAHPVPATERVGGPVPWSVRGVVLASAIWNIVSGGLWAAGLVTIPLAITCWVLAGFELRYVVKAGEMERVEGLEAARRLASWQIGALLYCAGPLTCCLGITNKWLTRRELAR